MGLVFLAAFTTGAAAIALWVDQRFAALAPGSLRARLILAGVGSLAVTAAPVSIASAERIYATFFGALFPALVLAFVSGIWLVRGARDAQSLR